MYVIADKLFEDGWHDWCSFPWSGGGSNSYSVTWKYKAYVGGAFVHWTNHWNVCFSSFRNGILLLIFYFPLLLNSPYILIWFIINPFKAGNCDLPPLILIILSTEDSDQNEKCGVYAILALIFPSVEWGHLGFLCYACKRSLHRCKLGLLAFVHNYGPMAQ